jgi:hypothetical protein
MTNVETRMTNHTGNPKHEIRNPKQIPMLKF